MDCVTVKKWWRFNGMYVYLTDFDRTVNLDQVMDFHVNGNCMYFVFPVPGTCYETVESRQVEYSDLWKVSVPFPDEDSAKKAFVRINMAIHEGKNIVSVKTQNEPEKQN